MAQGHALSRSETAGGGVSRREAPEFGGDPRFEAPRAELTRQLVEAQRASQPDRSAIAAALASVRLTATASGKDGSHNIAKVGPRHVMHPVELLGKFGSDEDRRSRQ